MTYPISSKLMLAIMVTMTSIFHGCKSRDATSRVQDANSAIPERCVALRGNGTHIVAQVMGLAKILPQWGEIHAFAGGSSSTITTFIYESISLNKAVRTLDEKSKASALALLLKSTIGYASQVTAEPEWQALLSFKTLAAQLQEKGAFDLSRTDYSKLASDISTIFGSDEFRDLINPEIFLKLRPLNDIMQFRLNVREVQKAALSLVNLDAEDSDVFFRPGVMNFSKFVSLIGRVADFYAGYGHNPPDMSAFINECSAGTDNLLWSEISVKQTRSGTCGERFAAMIRDWRAHANENLKHRIDDIPGLATKSIMITSVVKDQEAINKLRDYDKLYGASQLRNLQFNFDHIRFGYWVSPGLPLRLIDAWAESSNDLKAKKAIDLGSKSTWRQILEKSPQEPSLGKYVAFESNEHLAGAVSLGGWADLHPVQVLKAAGCQEVIYLTRRTDETVFISKGPPFEGRKPSGLAELLGMNKTGFEKIYSLDNPESSFSSALKAADGVWCTDWNKFSAFEQSGIALDAWNSPMLTKNQHLENISNAAWPTDKIRGCQ
jgi:hypothetical protein